MTDFSTDNFWNRAIRIAVIGMLSILSLFLLTETIRSAQDFGRPSTPATDTITVNGSGQAAVPPDVARVSFTVQNTASAIADAQAATTKQANAVLAYITQQGIANKYVTTLSYNITPQYAQSKCSNGIICPVLLSDTIVGYEVSETVQVMISNLSKVGTILQGLGTLGVQNVNGPNFGLTDPSAGHDAARANAIQNAQNQATQLANQLGVHLGKIVNFSESSNNSYPQAVYMNTASISSAPNIPMGENTYTANVSITYEIR